MLKLLLLAAVVEVKEDGVGECVCMHGSALPELGVCVLFVHVSRGRFCLLGSALSIFVLWSNACPGGWLAMCIYGAVMH